MFYTPLSEFNVGIEAVEVYLISDKKTSRTKVQFKTKTAMKRVYLHVL